MLPEELDPGSFVSAPWLAWQAALKKTKEKLDILNDMLLMLKKRYKRRNISLYLSVWKS